MRKIAFVSALALTLIVASCKKGPGEGGRSKIAGKIWVENYNTLNHMYDTYELRSEYAGADRDVYLIFGDDISYGMKTKSGPDGRFEFDYLRQGDYTVYVESKDTTRTSVSGITSMKVGVSLGKKETGDAGTIVVYN
ncbi:MAG TPA: hypothetical protein VF868_08050 [Bacteroidia bacterium]|jgi:hypothetical protein